MPSNEKLAQVNLVGLLSKECVGHDLATVLVNHRAVLAGEPVSHAVLKLRHGHSVAVPLVLNQLVVQLSEERAVIRSCGSKYHAAE